MRPTAEAPAPADVDSSGIAREVFPQIDKR
jgi:hypothetical protein